MIQSLIIGIAGLVFLMILWTGIQRWWGRIFSEEIMDEDVLADRRSCGNCGCSIPCGNALKK